MRFFGFRGFPKKHYSLPFFQTFPVQNRNLSDFSGLFQGFPSEKGGITKVRTILYKIRKITKILDCDQDNAIKIAIYRDRDLFLSPIESKLVDLIEKRRIIIV